MSEIPDCAFGDMSRALFALIEEKKALVQALRKYGRHRPICAATQGDPETWDKPCTCGWAEVKLEGDTLNFCECCGAPLADVTFGRSRCRDGCSYDTSETTYTI
jgi:hypothetical protein